MAAYRKLYDSIHREQKIERCREWREANPEHRKKYAERYAAENAERIATWKREWFAANRERLTERLHSDPDLLERRAASNRRHKERNRDVIAERQRRRRVDKLGLTIEDVDLDSLWTGRCGICSRPLDRDLRWPDPFSKSIDHIVPLSLGGTHEADNLQWAHLVCNIRKGNRMSE